MKNFMTLLHCYYDVFNDHAVHFYLLSSLIISCHLIKQFLPLQTLLFKVKKIFNF